MNLVPARSLKNRFRFVLLAGLRSCLRLRSTALRRPPAGTTVVVIAPHPDDETFGAGALLATLAPQHRAAVIFLTSGEASHPGYPALTPTTLAARREAEARTAASRLGLPVDSLHFLRLPDGCLSQLKPDEKLAAESRLATLLAELRPALVLLPWRRDGSAEHTAAFALSNRALGRQTGQVMLEFPVWSAWSPRLLAGLLLAPGKLRRFGARDAGAVKRHALAAYASQLEPVAPWTQSVLPADYVAAFSHGEEFFLETTR